MKLTFKVRKELIDIHRGKENLKICHISDTHIKKNSFMLDHCIRVIESRKPDLIVLTGDYYDTISGKKTFFNFLRYLNQKFICFVISGNHDHRYSINDLKSIDSQYNCSFLDNKDKIYVSDKGFEYRIFGKVDSNKKLDDRHVNILLIHNIAKVSEEDIKKFDIIFCGHMHGGQIILKTLKNGNHIPGSLFYKHCYDRKNIGRTNIIMSKGLGDLLPIRYNCPYELIFATIT